MLTKKQLEIIDKHVNAYISEAFAQTPPEPPAIVQQQSDVPTWVQKPESVLNIIKDSISVVGEAPPNGLDDYMIQRKEAYHDGRRKLFRLAVEEASKRSTEVTPDNYRIVDYKLLDQVMRWYRDKKTNMQYVLLTLHKDEFENLVKKVIADSTGLSDTSKDINNHSSDKETKPKPLSKEQQIMYNQMKKNRETMLDQMRKAREDMQKQTQRYK